jgi:5,10-methylenetetrahydromethanopterin reductase
MKGISIDDESMSVPVGVAFDGFVATGEALKLAQRAAAAGAASIWFAEHLGYREAIASCAAIAVAAPGPMLVPTAVSPYLWHATPTAMALATLDELAPGRTAVALGVGNPLFLKESGQSLDRPIRAMREYVAALRTLWSGEPAFTQGDFVKLSGARLAFRPHRIPVYIAAMGPDMLKLSGRIGDGVALSAGLSTRSVRSSLALCDEGAAADGRDMSDFRRAGYVFFGVSRDEREAVDAVRGKLAFLMRNKFLAQNIRDSGIPIDHEAVIAAIERRDLAGAAAMVPDEAVHAFGIAGRPDHCVRRLRDFVDAGLQEPVLSLVGTPENCALAIESIPAVAAQ